MNETTITNQNSKLTELTFNPHKWKYLLNTIDEVNQFLSFMKKRWPTWCVSGPHELLEKTVCFSSNFYYDNVYYRYSINFDEKFKKALTTDEFNFVMLHQDELFLLNTNQHPKATSEAKIHELTFQINDLMEQLAKLHSYLEPDNQKDLDNLTNAFRTFKDNL